MYPKKKSFHIKLSKGTYQVNIIANDDGTGGNTQVTYALN